MAGEIVDFGQHVVEIAGVRHVALISQQLKRQVVLGMLLNAAGKWVQPASVCQRRLVGA